MKTFIPKQSGSEVILEEVNPYRSSVIGYTLFTPLILTSIDPNIKPGDLIREDQLEISWQVKGHDWHNTTKDVFDMSDDIYKRQTARLKEEVKSKPFKIAFISDLIGRVAKGDISYSRMVEIMNERVQEHKPESEESVVDGIFSHVIKQAKNNPFVQASKIVDDYINDCCMDVPRRIGMDIMVKLYESGFEITKKI